MSKTPRQVRRWIRKQRWRRDFVRYSWKYRRSPILFLWVVTGHARTMTLMAAFDWEKTPQGFGWWLSAENDFMNWWRHGKK